MTLVILGDLFDFPRVFPEVAAATNSDADAIACLECIREGHPELFTDLGRLVMAGIDLVIVPGNHDRALARPPVFSHLQAMIAPSAPDSIRCEPWHVVEPGVFYAEHGQQYHDINAFERLLDADTGELSNAPMTIGGRIDELMRAAAKVAASSGGTRPETVVQVVRAAISSPRTAIRLARPLAGLALTVICTGLSPLLSRSSGARYRERLAALPRIEGRLDPESLVGIELIADRRRQATLRRLASTAARAAVSPFRHSGGKVSPRSIQSQRQLEAARAIDAVLRKQGEAVPIYVMGHTHIAWDEPLGARDNSSRLINTGTWIDGYGAQARTEGYPYAIIRHDPATGLVAGSLHTWNPDSSQICGR
jgi:UDP-2,3-diacylglucosamine pyrophosphatase LpxH